MAAHRRRRSSSTFLTIDEVRMRCAPCADEMRRRGLTRIHPRLLEEMLPKKPTLRSSVGTLRRLLNG